MHSNKTRFTTTFILIFSFLISIYAVKPAAKKIYFSYTLHGNMNYDRYPKSTIWEKFPECYQNMVDFIALHPDFKGQMQLSGQTYNTLKITKPSFLEKAKELQRKGIIDITGTFYSEPVNVCVDGETALTNATLGTSIINNEYVKTSGMFLQESAWNPQLPFILRQAGIDWTPIRLAVNKYYKPIFAVGLDGTKITVVEELYKKRSEYRKIIEEAPENSILLMGSDYENPSGFIQAYELIAQINKENIGISVEWIRVSDYLKKFPPTQEVFLNNSALTGVTNWDSYSRWTTDPLDIIIHTHTKKAMEMLRAAKIAVFASEKQAIAKNIDFENPDLPYSELQSYESDKGLDWDIEKVTDYPDIEAKYLNHNGKITMLTKAEHLLALGVNSDSRGWFPLFERRQERIESLKTVVQISQELIQRSLSQIGRSIYVDKSVSRTFMVFNAEKERNVTIELKSNLPAVITDNLGNQYKTKIFRQGNEYNLKAEIPMPEYGYRLIGLINTNKIEKPNWENGNEISNANLSIQAFDDYITIKNGSRSFKLSIDSFQVKLLAEMVYAQKHLEGWHKAIPHGPTRISICKNDLNPKIIVDRQVDWSVHLRQEYELKNDHIACKWNFFMYYPTLIRRDGEIAPNNKEQVFMPEGLMARLESNESGKCFYDVPYGITDNISPNPFYVCMQNFALLQQNQKGVMMVAKTGNQAVGVNETKGSLTLAMGASNASGPIRNPYMKVKENSVAHEECFYAEPFNGEYSHEFAIYPFEGSWQSFNASRVSRSFVNDAEVFELPVSNQSKEKSLPESASFITIDNLNLEITTMDNINNQLFLRINERSGQEFKSLLKVAGFNKKLTIKPFEIKKVVLD